MPEDKSSQRQFLVRVEGLEGLWARKSGGNTTAEPTRVYDGGRVDPDLVAAAPTTENVTVGRTYQRDRDQPILKRLRPLVGSYRTVISVTPTDRDLVAVGDPDVYDNAVLAGITEVEVDAAGNDPAGIELVFAVTKVR